MPSEIRTRVADGVTFQARAGGAEIPLTEEHLRAIGGILQGKIPGYSLELGQLFGKGILELGELRRPTMASLTALLPGQDNALLTLDPFAQVTVRLVGGGIEEALDASQAYSYFIAPALAVGLAGLAQALRAAGQAMHRNQLSRNAPLLSSEWLRTFEAIYRDHCGRKPLCEFMRIVDDAERGFRLELTQPIQAGACTYPEALLSVRRLDLPETAEMIAPLVPRALPDAGKLIRALGKGIGRLDLARLIADSPEGAHLYNGIAALVRAKALRQAPRPELAPGGILSGETALSALHLGHAGLLLEGGGTCVLVDPWFLPGHPEYRQQPLRASQMPPIEAIFLTHEHWDHVNAETLLRYPADVPIVVPRQDPRLPLHPRYREYLELFGCDRVIELGHWERMDLPHGMAVTAIPFRGEGTLEHGAPRNCYLIEREGKRILVHVDSSPDSLGQSDLTDGTIARLVAEHGTVDVVYATRRQELHFAHEIVSDLYPLLLGGDPRRLLQVIENCNCPASYLAELAAATGCAMLVLYSEGGAEWFPDDSNFLRSGNAAAFRGEDYLWDTLEQIEAAVSVPVRLSMPHDSVRLGKDGAHFIDGPLRA